MHHLQRITTEYIENEDRIRLTGKTADDAVLCLWLTRRLADRLTAALFDILVPAQQAPGADIFAQFAQQRAELEHTPQPPVRPPEEGPAAHLVQEVNIARLDGAIRLILREGGQDIAFIALTDDEMRQWLAILRQAYRAGEWPMQDWPDWLVETAAPSASVRQLN